MSPRPQSHFVQGFEQVNAEISFEQASGERRLTLEIEVETEGVPALGSSDSSVLFGFGREWYGEDYDTAPGSSVFGITP